MQKDMAPISFIKTPFREKFGIPRQPLLVQEAIGCMEFPKTDFFVEAFRGIENFSHLWLIFSFHEAISEGAKALVRPPRFEGVEKWGIYATRSPHRPNHLGLSAVKFGKIEFLESKIILEVRGVDLLDGTPILDIKPYLPYTDMIHEARAGVFLPAPELKKVKWSIDFFGEERELIEKIIALDPRPRTDDRSEFGVSIAGLNVRFRAFENEFEIFKITAEK
jgi:tRNA-Thr(GGU) m(6)t(6)A37 methyltransferase TsaA